MKPKTQSAHQVFADYSATEYVQLTRVTPEVAYQLAKMKVDWQAITYEQLREAIAESKREVLISWHIVDILSQAEDDGVKLSEPEAAYILMQTKRNHDSTQGINWEVISAHIQSFNDARIATRKAKKDKRAAEKKEWVGAGHDD